MDEYVLEVGCSGLGCAATYQTEEEAASFKLLLDENKVTAEMAASPTTFTFQLTDSLSTKTTSYSLLLTIEYEEAPSVAGDGGLEAAVEPIEIGDMDELLETVFAGVEAVELSDEPTVIDENDLDPVFIDLEDFSLGPKLGAGQVSFAPEVSQAL